MKGAVSLLENAAAGNGAGKQWTGGKTAFIGNGTIGTSVKLQINVDIGGTATWVDVSGMTLSAAGMVTGDLPPGQYRGVGTGGSGYYAKLVSIPQS